MRATVIRRNSTSLPSGSLILSQIDTDLIADAACGRRAEWDTGMERGIPRAVAGIVLSDAALDRPLHYTIRLQK
jgi:hypothetical protein